MPLFETGKGPVRDILRGAGNFIRGEELPGHESLHDFTNLGINAASGFLNNYTGHRDQANLQETWNREDTAIQRMVQDAETAGINPMALVGPGMGAPTSTPGSTQGRQSAVQDATHLAQFDKQLKLMDANINRINQAAKLDEKRGDQVDADIAVTNQLHEFRELYNDAQLKDLLSQIRNRDARTHGVWLNQELTRRNIEKTDLQIIREALGADLDALKIEGAELELLLKEIAIRTGEQNLKVIKHDLKYAQDNDLPVGSYNMYKDLANAISEWAAKFGDTWGINSLADPRDLVDAIQEAPETVGRILSGDIDENDPAVVQALEDLVGETLPAKAIRGLVDWIKQRRSRNQRHEGMFDVPYNELRAGGAGGASGSY